MKKKIISLLIAAATLFTAIELEVVADNENLLINGSFEDGFEDEGLEDKIGWYSSSTDYMCITDETSAYDGEKCIEIKYGANTSNTRLRSYPITVETNTDYILEYYTRSDSEWKALVQVLNTSSSKLGQKQTIASTNGLEWKKVQLQFNSGENEAVVVLIMGNTTATGMSETSTYFDAFCLRKELKDEIGVINNGGFEYDDELWTGIQNKFSITTEDKYDGEKSLKVTSESANFSNVRRILTLKENTKYILSYYAKQVSDSNFTMVTLYPGTEATSTLKLKELRTSSAHIEWTGFSYSFNTGENTEFLLEIKDGGATAYFDKFMITEIPEETPVVDAGFENGGEGWSFGNRWIISDEAAYSGMYSAKLPVGNSDQSYLSQTVNVSMNTDYTVSYYAKASGNWSGVFKLLGNTADVLIGETNMSSHGVGISSPDRWHYCESTFNSGENDTITISFMDNGGSVYIDDVKINRALDEGALETVISGTPANFDDKDEIRVAYLGGSITAGAGASSNDTRWTNQISQYLREKTGKNVTQIDAGVGGTGSDYGVYRLNENVISQNPDIVFIEFAVNDGSRIKADIQKNMESIIRSILSYNEKCSIVLVFTTNENMLANEVPGSIRYHQEVANYYGIPTINIHKYVYEGIKDGTFEKFTGELTDSSDSTHPNDNGYKVYANYIKSVIDSDFGKYICYNELKPESMTYIPYVNPHLESVNTAILGEGWTNNNGVLECSTSGASFEYTFAGRSFGYTNSVLSPTGGISITIDGVSYGTINFQGAPYQIIAETLSDTIHKAVITAINDNPISIKRFFADNDIEDEKIVIKAQGLKKDGKVIDNFEAEDEVTAYCGVINNTSDENTVIVAAAVYDEADRLINVRLSNEEKLTSGQAKLIETSSVTMPQNVNNYKVKVMVLKSILSLKPYVDAKVIESK